MAAIIKATIPIIRASVPVVALEDVALLIQQTVGQIQSRGEHSPVKIENNRTGEINWFYGDTTKAGKHLGYIPNDFVEKRMPAAVRGYIESLKI